MTEPGAAMSFSQGLARCACCPRRCRVNRLEEKTGFCGIGGGIRVSHIGLHFGEEPPISGKNGSGTVFFAGCNLRCLFCQNFQISQEFQDVWTWIMTVDDLADALLRLQDEGAHNVNFVSPSHMILQMADAIVAARSRGFSLPVVYNSGGYDSVEALRAVRGLVDIYLPDLKYLDNELGQRFSSVADYANVAPEVLREMFDQVGLLEEDDDGIAQRGLLVRHLVLPGFLDNSRACLRFLAGLSSEISVSLMSQYAPRHRAVGHPELGRPLACKEYEAMVAYAMDLGLENAFIQELDSQGHYVPDFEREEPFGES